MSYPVRSHAPIIYSHSIRQTAYSVITNHHSTPSTLQHYHQSPQHSLHPTALSPITTALPPPYNIITNHHSTPSTLQYYHQSPQHSPPYSIITNHHSTPSTLQYYHQSPQHSFRPTALSPITTALPPSCSNITNHPAVISPITTALPPPCSIIINHHSTPTTLL